MTASIGTLSIVVRALGAESASGTAVPPAPHIVDAEGSVWQLGPVIVGDAGEREILLNGAPLLRDLAGERKATAVELRYEDGVLYSREPTPPTVSERWFWWLWPPKTFPRERMFAWRPSERVA